MRFETTIPDPSSMRIGKETYVDLPTGTELHRIHQTRFGATGFNGTAFGDARFSPIKNAAGAIIPTIYAAQTFDCAACEVILRSPDVPAVDPKTSRPSFQIVFPADFTAFSHSVITTAVPLHLVDLTVAGQRKLGVDGNGLLAGPRSTYPLTQAWAERIHAECPTAQGLYYSSYQLGPLFAVILFGDRAGTDPITPVTTRPVADPSCHSDISSVAASLSIDYADI